MLLLVIHVKICLAVPEIVDWCQIQKKYCRGKNHLGCYNSATDKYYCPDIKIIDIPKEGKQLILNQFNEYRNYFAGGLSADVPIQASRMMRVEWSDSMEDLSRIAIHRCKKPSVCFLGDRGQGLFAYSQNMINYLNLNELNTYKIFKFDEKPKTYINNFLHELKHNKINVEIKEKEVTLTILIAFRVLNLEEDMNEIGCALGELPNVDKEDHGPKTIKLYCHTLYNKNYRTQLVQSFKLGPPCSECAEGQGCSIEYPNLCEYPRENIKEEENISFEDVIINQVNKSTEDIDMIRLIPKNSTDEMNEILDETDETDKKDTTEDHHNLIITMGIIIFILFILLIYLFKYQCAKPKVIHYPLVHISDLNRNLDDIPRSTKLLEANPNRVIVS